ncbi:M14 family metallocarboxypeptidase [Bacillus sp. FJAT-27445]|uniref:M14 family metallopeptidase n=1 Tax=Bacillus sp. FJAT-27445 TaxID=1679166 RepID=UPI000744402F|nr:M14 family metallocarboxypeptidase [Bacillus sp. FJAT-27445]
MEISQQNGKTLLDYSCLFQIPLELIRDSNEQVLDGKLEFEGKINIPGYTAFPCHLKREENLKTAAACRQLDTEMILLLNGWRQEKEARRNNIVLLPYKLTAPILIGSTEYCSITLERDLSAIKEAYPFVRLSTIGKSVLGKPIWELKIGSGKKKVHFNASFHANEWITSGILMELVNMYLLSLTHNNQIAGKSALSIYNSVELSIVPMVNPDGVDLVLHGPPKDNEAILISMNNGRKDFSGWKANCNGVDLNNQFPANWEIEKERKEPKSPSSRDFPGTAPLSEPEAIAMASHVLKNEFDLVVAFHTQGEEFYWGYGGKEPAESAAIAEAFAKVSGYKPVRTIDSHAGFKDWFIQEYGKAGFTIELGKGINPLPLSLFNKIYKDVSSIFITALAE